MNVLVSFLVQLVVIYLPLFIFYKIGKLSEAKILVWSTIWATIFTYESLSTLFVISEYIEYGYTMTTSDYIIVICIVLLAIGNIGLVKFLSKKFIAKIAK